MTTKAMIDRFVDTMRAWRRANAANVTVMFALTTVPIVGFVGAAVDYSQASSVKVAMQDAADATALMLAKTIIGASVLGMTWRMSIHQLGAEAMRAASM